MRPFQIFLLEPNAKPGDGGDNPPADPQPSNTPPGGDSPKHFVIDGKTYTINDVRSLRDDHSSAQNEIKKLKAKHSNPDHDKAIKAALQTYGLDNILELSDNPADAIRQLLSDKETAEQTLALQSIRREFESEAGKILRDPSLAFDVLTAAGKITAETQSGDFKEKIADFAQTHPTQKLGVDVGADPGDGAPQGDQSRKGKANAALSNIIKNG